MITELMGTNQCEIEVDAKGVEKKEEKIMLWNLVRPHTTWPS